jgi:hypothetical protein
MFAACHFKICIVNSFHQSTFMLSHFTVSANICIIRKLENKVWSVIIFTVSRASFHSPTAILGTKRKTFSSKELLNVACNFRFMTRGSWIAY